MKRCSRCGIEKPRTEFWKNKASKDGLRHWCAECVRVWYKTSYIHKGRERNKAWQKANSVRYKENLKRWYASNRKKVIAKAAAWRLANPDRYRARCRKAMRKYRADNPEKTSAADRKWRANNSEKVNAANRAWVKKNPNKVKAMLHRRRTRAQSAPGAKYLTAERIEARFQFYGYRCYICGAPNSTVLEHVIPLSKGGTSFPANVRPSCRSCNSKKYNKSLDKFIVHRGEPLWQMTKPRLP